MTLDDQTRREVESFVTDWLSDHRIPGAALAIVDGSGGNADDTGGDESDDPIAYAEGFGARDLEDNAPVTPDTLFGVGSCTKSFTAAAVLQLAAAGEVALDDPVNDYLPHLEDAPGEPVTVHELLAHTSGLPGDGSAGPLITRPLGLGHIEVPMSSPDDFRRHVEGSLDRRVTDRETFFYYNSGYTMLGLLVEAVTGESFADYVEAELLDPLGMERATFSKAEFEACEDRITPYVKDDDESTPSGFPFDPLIHAPGGLVAPVSEMATWVRTLAGGGVVGGSDGGSGGGDGGASDGNGDGSSDGGAAGGSDDGAGGDGTRVLPAERVAQMTTPDGAFGTYLDGTEVGYGYGLMVEAFLGDRLVGHGGSIAVSNAWFGYLEESGLGVAVACTTSPEAHPMAVGPAVLALLSGADPEDAVPHYRLVAALERATGEYGSYRGIGGATVERVGGMLRLEQQSGLGGQELLLSPESVGDDLLVCTTTMASGFEREVRFEFGDEGVDLFFERARLSKGG